MRSFRCLAARAAALLVVPALFAFAAPAEAGDCDCGPYRGHPAVRGGSVSCNRSGTCHVRDRCHPSTRYVIPRHRHRLRASGGRYGPWSEMRRHMGSARAEIRRAYVRSYFLRRHRFCLDEGAVLEEAADVGLLLAIGDEDSGVERPLDARGRLDRGTARFHVGEYDAARKDFEALVAADPDAHRARLGLVLCDVVAARWKAALGHLDVLAEAGELRKDDRFDVASLFADADKLPNLTKSLDETVGYRMTDARAHTVTAWLFAGQGDATSARTYVGLARRWGAATPTCRALERHLGLAPKPEPTPPNEGTAPAEPVRPPSRALHRQVARAEVAATR